MNPHCRSGDEPPILSVCHEAPPNLCGGEQGRRAFLTAFVALRVGDRLLAGGVDREYAGETGDPDDLTDMTIERAQGELSIGLLQIPGHLNQYPQAATADVSQLREIEHETSFTLPQEIHDPLLNTGGCLGV